MAAPGSGKGRSVRFAVEAGKIGRRTIAKNGDD
jgi:hypothetical protein